MHPGTAEELAAMRQRATVLAEQIAPLLTELEQLGGVHPAPQRIGFAAGEIRWDDGRWEVEPGR